MDETQTQNVNNGVLRDVDFGRKGRPLVPALDFLLDQDIAMVSVPLYPRGSNDVMSAPKSFTVIVTGGRRLCIPTAELPFRITNTPVFVDQQSRWREEELRQFLEGSYQIPAPAELLGRIGTVLDKYLDVPPIEIKLLSAWLLGSYLHAVWPAWGLLAASGPYGSGKSRCLSILSYLGFHPISLAHCTAPAMVRACNRATVLIDEAEYLGSGRGSGAAAQREMKLILQASYRQEGGEVIRCAGRGRLVRWPVFGPKVLAAINPLDEVLASRAIVLKMHRSTDTIKTALRLDAVSEDWAALRAASYATALTAWREIVSAPINAGGLAMRRLEIFAPLLQIWQWADPTGSTAAELADYAVKSGAPVLQTVAMTPEEKKIAQALASLPGTSDWLTSTQIRDAVLQKFPELATMTAAAIGLALAKHKLWAERRHLPSGKVYLIDSQRAAVLAHV